MQTTSVTSTNTTEQDSGYQSRIAELERRNAELASANTELESANAELESANAELESIVKTLAHEVRLLKDYILSIGRTRVGADTTPGQLYLFGEDPEASPKPEGNAAAQAEPNRENKKKSGSTGRLSIPVQIERIEVEKDHSDLLDCDCGRPGCQRIVIRHDISERVEIVPPQLKVWRETRAVLACPKSDNGIVSPPPTPRALPKCMAGDSLLVFIVMQKFLYHVPLHRVAKMIKDFGWRVPESTLCGWVQGVADALTPVVIAMKQWLLEQPYIQADETPAKARDPGKKGKLKQVYFWAYSLPWQEVIFDYQKERSGRHASAFLDGFKGSVVQVDEFSGYNALFQDREDLERAGCWSHAIRKFKAALQAADRPVESNRICSRLAGLFRLETAMRHRDYSTQDRFRVRQRIHVASLDIVRRQLDEALANPKVEPQSHYGKAVRYAHNHWQALTVFLRRGNVEMDNNGIENAMRGVALGRKNWMHIGHVDAGDRAAILYTLTVTCARLGIDVEQYLTHVLSQLPITPTHEVSELTPRRWMESQEQHQAGDSPSEDRTDANSNQ